MRHPVISKSRLFFLGRIACVTLLLADMFVFAAAGITQSPEKFTVSAANQSQGKLTYEGDKTIPRQVPGKSKSDTQRKAESSDQSATPSAPALTDPCVLTVLLVLDDVRTATVRLFNYPPGSTFTVTMTQTNAGVIGYSLNSAGPFTETVNVSVTTDGNGNGESGPFYIQGLNVGQTTSYGIAPAGPTTANDFTVIPQCNCPAIPAVP
jgi:hypothetical protein